MFFSFFFNGIKCLQCFYESLTVFVSIFVVVQERMIIMLLKCFECLLIINNFWILQFITDSQKMINDFTEEGIQVLNGRYGPYIKSGGRNYKIPKDKEAAELTVEDCQEIIKNAPPPRKRVARAKKS